MHDVNESVAAVAARHGFSVGAARALLEAMRSSRGAMAQFNHPELGGMGQWTRGGMLMIGDMFNHELKARVGALADSLARNLEREPVEAESAGRPELSPTASPARSVRWWPEELGAPAAAGAQNGMRYAIFPEHRRLAVERDGLVSVRDTGGIRITGVSQQADGTSSVRFSGDHGSVELSDFPEV